jgi:hypothetical protein
MEASFIAKPSEQGYVFSSTQLAKVPVHKIQYYFTNCVTGYMNHSFLALVQMQQFCCTSW